MREGSGWSGYWKRVGFLCLVCFVCITVILSPLVIGYNFGAILGGVVAVGEMILIMGIPN